MALRNTLTDLKKALAKVCPQVEARFRLEDILAKKADDHKALEAKEQAAKALNSAQQEVTALALKLKGTPYEALGEESIAVAG